MLAFPRMHDFSRTLVKDQTSGCHKAWEPLRPPEPEAVGSNPALPDLFPSTVTIYSIQFPLGGTGVLSQCDKIVTNLKGHEAP